METTATPTIHVAPTESRYADRRTVTINFRVGSERGKEYGFSFTPTGKQYRAVMNGPMLDGPNLSSFGTATVIAAYPLDADPFIVLNPGDIVEVDGERFTFDLVEDRWSKQPTPNFTPEFPPVTAPEATHTYTTSTGQRFGWIESQRFDHAHGNKHSGPTSCGRVVYADGTTSRPREVSVSALIER